jgi:hypothetical protein
MAVIRVKGRAQLDRLDGLGAAVGYRSNRWRPVEGPLRKEKAMTETQPPPASGRQALRLQALRLQVR